MPLDVIMPALGMAQDTGRIVAWHKASGDAVAAGDVLFEVETDKATMEVEAQEPGYLTDVAAAAGDDVPVGDVIARIADAPGDSASPSPAPSDNAPSPADALPEGNSVIMPTLGMAQDTGQLVAWHKTPGEAVAADDILFEVETDKSTVEVPAGFDGYIAAQLAEAGEDVPVGDTIAIISATPPDTPVVRRHATHTVDDNTPPAAEDTNSKPSPPPKPEPERRSNAARAGAPRSDGRILASPKARRLAREQGLDLERLVQAGHPQPYHVRDLEVLKALPTQAQAMQAQASQPARRLTAELTSVDLAAFTNWAAEHADIGDPRVLLAGLAGAGLERDDAVVAVEQPGDLRHFHVPRGALGGVTPHDGEAPSPDLILRDLRQARITTVAIGPEHAPVLTLTTCGEGLSLTLECSAEQLSGPAAVTLLSETAGRLEQPLRHLL